MVHPLRCTLKEHYCQTFLGGDVLVAPQTRQGGLFYTLLSILHNCASEVVKNQNDPKESVPSPSSLSLSGEVMATTSNGDHFTSINTIVEQCTRQITKNNLNPNIRMCAKNVPVNLDSIQIIQAALIFLCFNEDPESDCIVATEEHQDDIFPRMPLLWSNPKELNSGNINTAAFQLVRGIDLDNVEFVEKLMRLESFFFTSTDVDDNVPRIRMVPPRSHVQQGIAARAEQEKCLKRPQVLSNEITKSSSSQKEKVVSSESGTMEKTTTKRTKTS